MKRYKIPRKQNKTTINKEVEKKKKSCGGQGGGRKKQQNRIKDQPVPRNNRGQPFASLFSTWKILAWIAKICQYFIKGEHINVSNINIKDYN